MLRSNSKSLGNHVASPEEKKERLQWERFAEKEGFKLAVSDARSVRFGPYADTPIKSSLPIKFLALCHIVNVFGACNHRPTRLRVYFICSHELCVGKLLIDCAR